MDRRGFLGALGAFTTALASGVRMPTGKEAFAIRETRTQIPESDDFPAPEIKPSGNSAQEMLMRYLSDCEVTGISNQFHFDSLHMVTVTYLYREGVKGGGPMSREAAALTAGKRPVSAMVTTFADPLDITTFEAAPIRTDLAGCAGCEIEVVWA
jgi:hypothetical protein